ncbi:acyltransferase family protein [Sphingobacterium chungjuense]|uniref:acyltransferase family protein n=1 Tax=Sphingobacterium chungjuense TaxID=2675553 RepID=UPI00140E1C91|nr:acyltransferase [Sphingobacterium chungjuense]
MKEDISLDQRQSEVIDFLRFPLIVLVVYVHMLPFQQQPISSELKIYNAYVIISELISHHIGRIAVPAFFLFSGYFFFLKISSWNTKVYTDRLKNRYRTLLIPYISWSLIMIAAIVLKNYAFVSSGLPFNDGYQQVTQLSIYEMLWGMPINYPLWYVRDLIVMVVLTPLFYYFFRFLKFWGLLLLLCFYLSLFESGLPGLSSTAIFFFGAGAYFGLSKQNMLQLSLRYETVTLCLTIITLGIATYYTAMPQNEWWIRLFAISAASSLLAIGNKMLELNRLRKLVLLYAEAAFFIYVSHIIYILGWFKGALQKSLSFMPDIWLIIGYFLMPLTCISLIIMIYYIVKKFLPKTLIFVTGNRAN